MNIFNYRPISLIYTGSERVVECMPSLIRTDMEMYVQKLPGSYFSMQ